MSELSERIYLDNAATSFPKPPCVYDAVDHYQRTLGVAVGRGATNAGRQVQQIVDRCRNLVTQLLGGDSSDHTIFTFNGTDSLNLALHGILNEGDRVITTCWEHNSVLRPLNILQGSHFISTDSLSPTSIGQIDLDELRTKLRTPTKLVCITHASNVTGVVQPVVEIAEIAHQSGALVLLDAAQTAGHLPISMSDLGVDLLACPGHKGLLGPLGTGILLIKPGIEEQLSSIRQGGTGTTSESPAQPNTLPEKYESGNHNAPGIVGLTAALEWLSKENVEKVAEREHQLSEQLLSGLCEIAGIDVYLADASAPRVGLASCNATHLEPQVFSSLLDEHFGIETRAGLHCAPQAHAAIQTLERGGTVRFSVGPFTQEAEIDHALESVGQITAAF